MRQASGMTLMEVLAALLVLTILVMAMGTSMELALRAYEDTLFASESGALAGILQTALQDLLGFAEDIQSDEEGNVRFTNREFGLRAGYLCLQDGMVCLKGETAQPLIGAGAYGKLTVEALQCSYFPPGTEAALTLLDGSKVIPDRGGFFYVSFGITDGEATRDTELVVRVIGAQGKDR